MGSSADETSYEPLEGQSVGTSGMIFTSTSSSAMPSSFAVDTTAARSLVSFNGSVNRNWAG